MLASATVNTAAITVELVLARYSEDPGWAEELGVPVTVYNKGAPLAIGGACRVEPLPNVGREAHSYLFHILRRWPDLADWTVFCQADPFPHLGGIDLRYLLRPAERFRVPWRVRLREWGADGRLQWNAAGWQERYAAGEIRPAPLSLLDYGRRYLGVDLRPDAPLAYHPGAILAVPKAAILARGRAVYARLLETVFDHAHPEEAHYLERLWPRLFTDGAGW